MEGLIDLDNPRGAPWSLDRVEKRVYGFKLVKVYSKEIDVDSIKNFKKQA